MCICVVSSNSGAVLITCSGIIVLSSLYAPCCIHIPATCQMVGENMWLQTVSRVVVVRLGTGIRAIMMGTIQGKLKKISSLACAGDSV